MPIKITLATTRQRRKRSRENAPATADLLSADQTNSHSPSPKKRTRKQTAFGSTLATTRRRRKRRRENASATTGLLSADQTNSDPPPPIKRTRKQTAYGAMDRRSKSNHQGPHNVSFIGGSVALEQYEAQGGDLLDLLNTALAPTPTQALHILNERFRQKGGLSLEDHDVLAKRKRWYKRYKTNYAIAANTKESQENRKKALHNLIEATPAATYRIVEGEASRSDMAGKGERRTNAWLELRDLRGYTKNTPIPPGLKIVDSSGFSTTRPRVQYDTRKRLTAFVSAYSGDCPEIEDTDGSDEEEVLNFVKKQKKRRLRKR